MEQRNIKIFHVIALKTIKKLEKSQTSCINTAECCMLKITLPKLSSSCCKKNKEVMHILPVQTHAASDWA